MSQDVNIREIINQSTSDVPLSELAKKGFKQVKVLNKGLINELIEQAVGRVIVERSGNMSGDERNKIHEQSRTEFKKLLAKVRSDGSKKESCHLEKIQAVEAERDQLTQDVAERETRIVALEKQIAHLEGEVQAFREAPGSAGGVGEIKETIEKLVAKISAGAAAQGIEIKDDEAMLEFVLNSVDEATLEHNVGDVVVRESKAGGVSSTLEKLKSLKGGSDREDQ